MPEDEKTNLSWLTQRLGTFRTRLKRADRARDSGDWENAASAYRDLWVENTSREALLIQSGNCAKEARCAPDALGAYLNVTQPEQRTEAALQLGHLLKITGNSAAAAACYDWSAREGNGFAALEREDLAGRSGGALSQGFYRRSASALMQNDLEFVASLSAAERWPLDCAQLAHAAQSAAIEGLGCESAILTDLALIVGGPSTERRSWYEKALQAQARLRQASSSPKPLYESAQAALSALAAAGASERESVAAPAATSPGLKSWPGEHLIVLEPEIEEATAAVETCAERLVNLRKALFEARESDLRGAIADFVDAALPEDGRVYVSIPDERGVFSPRLLARRVALNCSCALARRLASTLRATARRPSWLAPLFWLPTGVASAATNHDWDRLTAVAMARATTGADADRAAQSPSAAEQIDDALLEGAGAPVIPLERERAALMRAADRGRSETIERWLDGLQAGNPARRDTNLIVELSRACKRAGDWLGARKLIERALRLRPKHVEFELELGILSKTLGDFASATACFTQVLGREPENECAARELAMVAREHLTANEITALCGQYPAFAIAIGAKLRRESVGPAELAGEAAAVPALLPAEPARNYGDERFEVLQIGHLRSNAAKGAIPRLTGVVAIRVRAVSADTAVGLRIRLDGRTLDYVEPSCAGTDSAGRSMFYFNSWINTVDLPRGTADLQLNVEYKSSGYSTYETLVLIDDELPDGVYPDSDGLVFGVPRASGRELVDAVNALPETVREANRRAFSGPLSSILVMRLDQLGDVAASLAGMRRLKQLFPGAAFEALVTPANELLVRSSGLFDVVTSVDFPYDHGTRRRHLSRTDEFALRRRYASKPIDLAIDLSPGTDSRPVLKLVNATYSAGFKPREFDFLDFGVDLITRDPVNRKENISHTAMINALVEAIGAAVAPPPERFVLPESSQRHLAPYGLTANDYVVIHSGARLAIKRWPLEHYVELTKLIRQRAQRPVVFIADEPLPAASAQALRQDQGVIVFEGRLEFDVLDAVIANARLFIGNDTGPKHLAAVRGVFTVSVHMDQVNWNEWGQDGEGYIISRRAPCCGCGIEDPGECGKAMACLVQIRPSAVADAAIAALEAPSDARRTRLKTEAPKLAAG